MMKIQCNVCDAAEANVFCCADEAALCWDCDRQIHAANKLVSKHQRVPLSSSLSQMPKCDICQETLGYFFCLEDRTLLCRKCDVAIHSANSFVSVHQRFLLNGVKVGLEAAEHGPSSSSVKTQSIEKISEPEPQYIKNLPVEKFHFATGNVTQWKLDDFLGLGDLNQNYDFINTGSSKADKANLEGSNCTPNLGAVDGVLEGNDCMDHVPDTFWAVPQIPSLASDLYGPKNHQNLLESPAFVPDMGSSRPHVTLPQSGGGNCKASITGCILSSE